MNAENAELDMTSKSEKENEWDDFCSFIPLWLRSVLYAALKEKHRSFHVRFQNKYMIHNILPPVQIPTIRELQKLLSLSSGLRASESINQQVATF